MATEVVEPASASSGRVSRSGATPEPTVTVRMEENAVWAPACVVALGDRCTTKEDPMHSPTRPDGRRLAVVAARWHADIVDSAVASLRDTLAGTGVDVTVFEVPGAFEIPLQVRRLALSGEYDAVAACALVVDGGIYRHDFVAGSVVDALMRVQLETDVPVFSAVLTPHQFHDHEEHRAYFTRHFAIKGAELAHAVTAILASEGQPELATT